MSKKYITAFIVGFIAMIGWNVFLIQRDQQMFDGTPKERYCQQQAGWHPDCNLE